MCELSRVLTMGLFSLLSLTSGVVLAIHSITSIWGELHDLRDVPDVPYFLLPLFLLLAGIASVLSGIYGLVSTRYRQFHVRLVLLSMAAAMFAVMLETSSLLVMWFIVNTDNERLTAGFATVEVATMFVVAIVLAGQTAAMDYMAFLLDLEPIEFKTYVYWTFCVREEDKSGYESDGYHADDESVPSS